AAPARGGMPEMTGSCRDLRRAPGERSGADQASQIIGEKPDRPEHEREKQDHRLHRNRCVPMMHVVAINENSHQLVERQEVDPGDDGNVLLREKPRYTLSAAE